MPYMHMLSDPGMNYTLNRPLLDGTSPARIKEIGAVAPPIKDYESWHAVWLGLAKRRRHARDFSLCGCNAGCDSENWKTRFANLLRLDFTLTRVTRIRQERGRRRNR